MREYVNSPAARDIQGRAITGPTPMALDPHPQPKLKPPRLSAEARNWLSENRPVEAARIRDVERRK